MECDLRHDVGHHKCLWITQMCLELVFGKHFNSLCLFLSTRDPFRIGFKSHDQKLSKSCDLFGSRDLLDRMT